MSEQQSPAVYEDGLSEIAVETRTVGGASITIPGLTHEACPGLAVTMFPFGTFAVTHVSTGARLCGNYERASSALLVMSQFALIADMKGKSWADMDRVLAADFIKECGTDEVPFGECTSTSIEGTRKMTVSEWFQCVRLPFPGEFPWEEKDPFERALDNLNLIEVAQ